MLVSSHRQSCHSFLSKSPKTWLAYCFAAFNQLPGWPPFFERSEAGGLGACPHERREVIDAPLVLRRPLPWRQSFSCERKETHHPVLGGTPHFVPSIIHKNIEKETALTSFAGSLESFIFINFSYISAVNVDLIGTTISAIEPIQHPSTCTQEKGKITGAPTPTNARINQMATRRRHRNPKHVLPCPGIEIVDILASFEILEQLQGGECGRDIEEIGNENGDPLVGEGVAVCP